MQERPGSFDSQAVEDLVAWTHGPLASLAMTACLKRFNRDSIKNSSEMRFVMSEGEWLE